MAVNIGSIGLLSQQYPPPPLFPKPGKENVRLQKLLKKSAKKKAAAQTAQQSVPFRSSLSPVNEASPDLEHSDHSTPPKTPETPVYTSSLHPRFTVRPLYQHVSSPYPHHRGFPQDKPASPSFSYPPGLQKPIAILQTSHRSGLYLTTVNVQRSKPLFEVPQITNYTARGLRAALTSPTRSKTPSELLRSPTPTVEVRRIVTPTEIKRDVMPSRHVRRVETPSCEVERTMTPTVDHKKPQIFAAEPVSQSRPSSGPKRISTPASEITRGASPRLAASFDTRVITTSTRVLTPIIDFTLSKTSSGRPKTPSDHISRVRVSVIEISRPNPLLFSVSPVYMEERRSRTPTPSLVEEPRKALMELKDTDLSKVTQNADQDSGQSVKEQGRKENVDETTSVKNVQTEPLKTKGMESAKLIATESQKKEVREEVAKTGPSLGRQKPLAKVPPFQGQRPRTPTTPKPRPAYYDLTPNHNAANRGMKSVSPTIGSSLTSVEQTDCTKTEPISPQSLEKVPFKANADSKKKAETSPPQSAGKTNSIGDVVKLPEETKPKTKLVVDSFKIPTIVVSTADAPSDTEAVDSLKPPSCETSPQVTTASPDVEKEKPAMAKTSLLKKMKESSFVSGSSKNASENHKDVVKPPDALKDDHQEIKNSEIGDRVEAKESPQPEVESVVEKRKEDDSTSPKPLLKMGMKSKLSGWSRLKKHMVVEAEEPKFPEPDPSSEQNTSSSLVKSESETPIQPEEPIANESLEKEEAPRATKMWDAVLFQMFSTEENIIQQIEANKTEEQKKMEAEQKTPKEIPSFAHRLPVLLYSPRFDARRLREAASRPATKIAMVFEMGLIGRKNKDEEPKDFNRTARGFTT